MKREHQVFSIAEENPAVPGCTISGQLMRGVTVFSLAKETDISAESYPVPILQVQLSGSSVLDMGAPAGMVALSAGELMKKPAGRDIGVAAKEDSVYLEIALEEEDSTMNPVIKEGNVFRLKDLIPYQEGKIVNMDLVSQPSMKFVVMAFDEGTGLSEHSAPGDAIVFALDGKAVIGYEGKEYPISAGEQFRFAKGGLHSVKADGKFKMALLLVLEGE